MGPLLGQVLRVLVMSRREVTQLDYTSWIGDESVMCTDYFLGDKFY